MKLLKKEWVISVERRDSYFYKVRKNLVEEYFSLDYEGFLWELYNSYINDNNNLSHFFTENEKIIYDGRKK